MTPHQIEIQNLRTKINKLEKCIGRVYWTADHINNQPYDHGEGYAEAIVEIKEIISDLMTFN